MYITFTMLDRNPSLGYLILINSQKLNLKIKLKNSVEINKTTVNNLSNTTNDSQSCSDQTFDDELRNIETPDDPEIQSVLTKMEKLNRSVRKGIK